MDFIFTRSINLEQSYSSKARTSTSKRGINVTLSKQKSNSPQGKCISKTNQTISQNVSIQSNEPANYSDHIKQKNFSIQPISSNETGSMYFTQKKSTKSDLILGFFQKNHQKQEVKKESAVLDQQIRKLQLEIYNTRTKITEAKYLARKQQEARLLQTIKNNRKSKEKIYLNELQMKSNKSLKKYDQSNISLKTVHKPIQDPVYLSQNNTYFSNKSPVSGVKSRSPLKIMRSQARSRSPSPPHPSQLKHMLQSKKKSVPFASNLQKYQDLLQRKDDFFSQKHSLNCSNLQRVAVNQSPQNNSSRVSCKDKAKIKEQQKNYLIKSKDLKLIQQKVSKDNTQTKNRKSVIKVSKNSTKKRSMSAYTGYQAQSHLDKIINNQSVAMKRSSERLRKRKSKVSDFDSDLSMVLKGKDLKNIKNIRDLNSSQNDLRTVSINKNKKGKKTVLANKLVTKAYSKQSKEVQHRMENVNKKQIGRQIIFSKKEI